MTVAALSTAGFSQYIAASSNVSASQQAWQSLQQNLAQGNMTAAQSAFKTYSQLNPAPTSSSGSSDPSQLSTDMTALDSALGSGNLSTAQSAFSTVQSDLKSTPSQAITNAESAAAQTVQWVDDLLSLSGSNNSSSTPVDPATAMLDSAYGLSSSSNTTDPMVALLESKYDAGSTGSASSAGTASSAASAVSASSGNAGNSASVNAYA